MVGMPRHSTGNIILYRSSRKPFIGNQNADHERQGTAVAQGILGHHEDASFHRAGHRYGNCPHAFPEDVGLQANRNAAV